MHWSAQTKMSGEYVDAFCWLRWWETGAQSVALIDLVSPRYHDPHVASGNAVLNLLLVDGPSSPALRAVFALGCQHHLVSGRHDYSMLSCSLAWIPVLFVRSSVEASLRHYLSSKIAVLQATGMLKSVTANIWALLEEYHEPQTFANPLAKLWMTLSLFLSPAHTHTHRLPHRDPPLPHPHTHTHRHR